MKKLALFAAVIALSGCSDHHEAEEYGDAWPFTSESVFVGCDAMGLPYVEAPGVGTFGLTGYAVQQGYPPVDRIHRQGRSLSTFIEAAMDKCPA